MKMFAAMLAGVALFASAASAETVLIRGGRIVTNTSAAILETGDVLIENGRISAVAARVTPPAGARIIDAKGKWVTPGVFAAMSELGLYEISGSGAPNDANVAKDSVSAAANAADGFDPATSAIAVTRIEGVTRAAIAPSSAEGLFSGQGALISLSGDSDSVFAPRAFIMLKLGEDGAARTGGSRAATWATLNAALRDAREYPQRYRSGQGGAVLREIDAEALAPFARGEGLILAQVERAADIRALIQFARANPRLRFAIHGGAEGWMVAKEIAAARIPVILDPFAALPDRFERLGARPDNAALMQAAGVTIAIAPAPGTVDAQQTRLALQLAGNAVAHGLDWQAAFAAITLGPAKIFGVDRDFGALAKGKAGDVVIWDGDPLELMSAPTAVFIAGTAMPLTSRQTALRDRYMPKGR